MRHWAETGERDSCLCPSPSCADSLREALKRKVLEGYWTAGLDSILPLPPDSNHFRVYLSLGPRFEASPQIHPGNVPQEFYTRPERRLGGLVALEKQRLRILQKAENRGYPFAALSTDSLSWNEAEQRLDLAWHWEAGPKVLWSKIVLDSTSGGGSGGQGLKLKAGYFKHYLGIKPGQLYDESRLRRVDKRLRELPFVQIRRPAQVVFLDNQAELYLFLQKRRASRFDILLGFLPGQDPGTGQQRLQFTGNVLIDLHNSLNRGENFYLAWRQLQRGISEFQTKLHLPYLFGSPLGVEGDLQIYRRDSTYVDVIGLLGLQYLFDGGSYLKAFWQDLSTNVLQPDTAWVRRNRNLPQILDTKTSFFGLEYRLQRLDYRHNPRRGFEGNWNTAFGLRRLRPHIQILALETPDFSPQSLYDSLGQRGNMLRLQQQLSAYIPIWGDLVLRLHSHTAWIERPNGQLYANELWRLGGSRRLRGFDEEQFQASFFQLFSLETRYLLNENSYAFLFLDGAQTYNPLTKLRDRPWGFGAGIVLDTKIGLFGLTYALGQARNQALDIRYAKIHFGYVSRF